MAAFDVIAFDADDTLWHNESLYVGVKRKLVEVLAPYASSKEIEQELDLREENNISYYGYGIKSFTLSMIEAAILLSDRKVHADEIQKIITFGKEMLDADVQLMNYVQETISHLAEMFTLMIITKGDLLDQERKLSVSGIDKYFEWVEIVSKKTRLTYKKILTKNKIQPERFIMVGNSLKSDILPVISVGGCAVHVPAEMEWSLDVVPNAQLHSDDHYEIEHMGQLPNLIESIGER